ncbi:MAG: PhaM family polyhydroxyalkanoate granule multifunctional regulatory protein [Thauera sp.]
MSQDQNAQDPLEFVRGMWNQMGFSLPGMVTPTLDVDELDKRITDMRAVEGWLKMNLNMLQMSIQGLEMQRAALAAVRAMSQQAQQGGEGPGAGDAAANPFAAAAAMWPWNLMGNAGEAQPAAEGGEQKAAPRSTRRKTPTDK